MKWRAIPGWPGYEASTAGGVRSARGELKLVPKGGRYLCVTLSAGERRKQYLVHDLVALAFIGPKPAGAVVRHLDDVKTNNTRRNLRYGTHAQNEADRRRNDRIPRGASHGCAKLSEADVQFIRGSALPRDVLAVAHGVHPAHIHAVQTRRVWRHV